MYLILETRIWSGWLLNTGNKSCTRSGSSPVALKISLEFSSSSFYSSAKFRRVTPPTALRKPQQYIHQNVRLDREMGAIIQNVQNPIFPRVIPKIPGNFSIENEWEFFFKTTNFHLFSESPSSLIPARRNVIQTLKRRKTCALSKTPNCFYITCKLFKLWAVKRGVEITFSSKLEWKRQLAWVWEAVKYELNFYF